MVCNVNKSLGVSAKAAKEAKKVFDGLSIPGKHEAMNNPYVITLRNINIRGLTVNGNKGTAISWKGNEITYADEKGNNLTANLTEDAVLAGGTSLSQELLASLQSDASFVQYAEKDYTLMSRDIVNEPDRMVQLASELNGLSPEPDSKHASYLLKNVSKLARGFKQSFPSVAVMLNKEADKNGGSITLSKAANAGSIYVNIGPGKNNMSVLEIYTHELFHAATSFALGRKDVAGAGIRTNIRKIRDTFLNNDKTLGMLTKELGSEKEAIEMIKYLSGINDSGIDTGMEEFVAYSQTNKAVINVLKKLKTGNADKTDFGSLFEKLAYYVSRMFSVLRSKVTGVPNTNDYDRMVVLTERLMQTNNEALEKKKAKLSSRMAGWLYNWNDKLAKRGQEYFAEKDKVSLLKENTSTLGKIGFVAKLIGKSFYSETARKQTAMLFTFGTNGYLDETSTLQSIVGETFDNDEFKNIAEGFAQESGNLDRQASVHRQLSQVHITESFKQPLSSDDKKGLNVILDTDLLSLSDEFDIGDMVSNESERQKAIKQLKDRLPKDKSDRAYFEVMIDKLAHYMLTGEGDSLLLKNAYAIANMVNDPVRQFKNKKDKKLVDTIDKLVTLQALNKVSYRDLQHLSDLTEKEPDGVEVFIDYAMSNKIYAEDNLFKGDQQLQAIKGYRTLNLDKDIETKIAPLANRRELEQQGYKYIENGLQGHPLDTASNELGYFVNTMPVRTRWHRGAIAMDRTSHKGMSVKESNYLVQGKNGLTKAESTIAKMRIEMINKITDIRKGNYKGNSNKESSNIPMFDSKGKLVDFGYEMSRSAKEHYLKANNDPIETIGNVKATSWKKVAIPEQNRKIAKSIKKENKYGLGPVREGVDRVPGANMKTFRWIGPDSKDPKMVELWRMLPHEVKEEFTRYDEEDKKVSKGFYIRNDTLHTLTGYTEFALTDTAFVQKNVPKIIISGMKIAGKIWKAIVSIYKSNILLRIPEVLFANVLSNIFFSLIYLKNPAKVISYQLKGVEALSEYIKMVEKQAKLEVAHRTMSRKVSNSSGTQKVELQKQLDIMSAKLQQSISDLKNSEVSELVDEGFYTQILEEIEAGESGNIIKDTINDKLDKAPSLMRNGLEFLWLSDKNPITKFMHTSTQFSDFVARYAHYNLMKENGKGHNESINTVRGMFVNYNVPSSPLVEWSNQMGFVMFTKYFTRIQKAIGHAAKNNPIGVALSIAGQEALFDIPDPTDSYFMFKDLGNLFYSPVDTAIGAATPGLYLFTNNLM